MHYRTGGGTQFTKWKSQEQRFALYVKYPVFTFKKHEKVKKEKELKRAFKSRKYVSWVENVNQSIGYIVIFTSSREHI